MKTQIINGIEIVFTGKWKRGNKNDKLLHEILCIFCKIPKLVSQENLIYGKGLSHKSCSMRNVRKLSDDPIENSKRKVAAYYLTRMRVVTKASKKNRETLLNEDNVYKIIFNDCFYCGVSPSRQAPSYYNIKYNGIDRLNNDLGYIKDNCVACCIICNRAKHALSLSDFNNWIDRLIEFQLNKRLNNDTKNEIYKRGSDSALPVALSTTN